MYSLLIRENWPSTKLTMKSVKQTVIHFIGSYFDIVNNSDNYFNCFSSRNPRVTFTEKSRFKNQIF